ncbi:28 kDa ribonucleoprotein, chloroplastic [Carica papaya]|uniref:28 kDa ribonucleoprotein, chloroplastic n=1 Tax=Carica papaya TaxID=3649 RepID=UPI000B8CD016|nr:28 kDa ribonucleoprotein, chloroplastic [Carica papaya]
MPEIMAVLEAAFSAYCFSSFHPSSSSKFHFSPKTPPSLVRLHIFKSADSLSSNFLYLPSQHAVERFSCAQCSTVQEARTDSKTEKVQQSSFKRKLFVLNLPWSFSVADVKDLFGQCGSVVDVEIIKQKDGRSRGFAFVTMSSGQGAQAAVDKFDSHEVSGRIIRVEFAKRFKKPSPLPPPSLPSTETHHKLYVSNLAWKVRSSHLREFFSVNFNPVSARVVFDSPSGKAAGYGFVSFASKEEAEAAISALDGKVRKIN